MSLALAYVFYFDKFNYNSLYPPRFSYNFSFYPPSGHDTYIYDFQTFVLTFISEDNIVILCERSELFLNEKTTKISQNWGIYYQHPLKSLSKEKILSKIHGKVLWLMFYLGLKMTVQI